MNTDFSIVTPSFRQPEWLRLCLASVADQEGVTVEHIVQDACSGSAVVEVCRAFPRVLLCQEPDQGMYDAVNRGLRKGRGRICAYLNCDEQYLPGALARVKTFFADHPETDVAFGDAVVTNAEGGYVCSRQALVPNRFHTATCQLNTFSGATFFRRKVFEEYGCWFDPSWRNCGDAEWMLRLLGKGVQMATMGEYTTVFTETGQNLNLTDEGNRERERLRALVSPSARALAPLWLLCHRIRRLARGHYRPKAFACGFYRRGSAGRATLEIARPVAVWHSRFSLRR